MRTEAALLAAVLASVIGGCAAADPHASLPAVEQLVATRTSLARPQSTETTTDDAIDATVAELLSTDLTVESAVRIALLNNRNLRALYFDLDVAEAELVQAGLLPNPLLSANVRFGLGPSGTGAELGLVQELIDVLQIPLRRRVAEAHLEVAKLELADAILDLALRTKAALYEVQGATQMRDLAQNVETATGLAREVAERQRDAGNVTELDVATQRALHAQAKLDLAATEAELLDRREALNVLLGLWKEQARWQTAARLERPPSEPLAFSGLETRAVSQRLDLAAARARSGGSLAELSMTRVFGLLSHTSAGVVSERDLAEGGWSVGPQIELPIPLFDRNQARGMSAIAKLRAANERHAALAVAIRSDVRRSWASMETARARALYYEQAVLPVQARIVEQTQREYNGMLVGVFQLLEAKRDEIEAAQGYIRSLTDYWVSRVELESAIGGDLAASSIETPERAPVAVVPDERDDAATHQHHHGG